MESQGGNGLQAVSWGMALTSRGCLVWQSVIHQKCTKKHPGPPTCETTLGKGVMQVLSLRVAAPGLTPTGATVKVGWAPRLLPFSYLIPISQSSFPFRGPDFLAFVARYLRRSEDIQRAAMWRWLPACLQCGALGCLAWSLSLPRRGVWLRPFGNERPAAGLGTGLPPGAAPASLWSSFLSAGSSSAGSGPSRGPRFNCPFQEPVC
ncbi:hypothetical protein P7K49_002249 [Saguinus oedipus]|uniref:Uncharacterized protein n=1 Tax=Saguinus oedipus TaxID=9490 RepID=A0ABQ9WJI0_SAGOE|nr:hypothetical protein P7K49_002249 [Saguinus oedipus]